MGIQDSPREAIYIRIRAVSAFLIIPSLAQVMGTLGSSLSIFHRNKLTEDNLA
jgi:hypothetical protein